MKPKIILTFDLEFWHNSNFLEKYPNEEKYLFEDYIIETTEPILNLLNEHGHKATFFVLGQVAEKYPELIKKISDLGHEIASHGYSHKSLYDMGKEDFEKEISRTNEILKKITGEYPSLFRAPAFSLKKNNTRAMDILKKYNMTSVSKRPVLAGGIYFRIMPLRFFLWYLKMMGGNEIPILYFHPYEFFDSAPKISWGTWLKRKIKYLGTKNARKKFEKIMECFEFISIRQTIPS